MKVLKIFYLLLIMHAISLEFVFAQCGSNSIPNVTSCFDFGESYNDYELVSGGKVSDLIGSCLLPATSAATTPQKIILLGVLEVDIDYSFAANSKIITFKNDDYPEIEITSSSLLKIHNSTILSCGNLWQGITVNSGSRLELFNTTLYSIRNNI